MLMGAPSNGAGLGVAEERQGRDGGGAFPGISHLIPDGGALISAAGSIV